jgi:hypothetical protein
MNRPLRVGIIDLVSKGPERHLYARVMNANLASIMPQVVSVWCEEEGHRVQYECFTGVEDPRTLLEGPLDIVFICAFTEAAQLAYALSNFYRSTGALTALGGPHARCYPQDACRHFDYVLGFTDRAVIRNVLADRSRHRPRGQALSAKQQPESLPGVRARWKFIAATLAKAPWIKVVPMLGSMGCPYACSFCIDSTVPYHPLDLDVMKEDLRFLLTKFKRPLVAWHDPNFGVRFNETVQAIEEAVPADRMDFIAESSLSILSEPNVKRLRHIGVKAVLPGIESWFSLGNKSKTGRTRGREKVAQVAEHIDMILGHIPYVQTNFVLGLDSDEGPEPFDLTRQFLERCPAVFPAFSLLSAFGQASPLNLEYQREGRVLPFPFHLLNNCLAMNIKPKNYDWREFYGHVVKLTGQAFSPKALLKRFWSNQKTVPKLMNLVRGVSAEGRGRHRYYNGIRRRLDSDPQFLPYFEGETDRLPDFHRNRIRKDLGSLWNWLPDGALNHDAHAYLKSVASRMESERLIAALS